MQIDKRAFTLIELIIVVAIISISYSLVVPNIKNSTTDSVNLSNLKEYLLSLNFDKRASIVCFEDDKECSIYLDNRVLKHKISLFHDKIYAYKIAPNDELITQEFSDIIVDGFSKRVDFRFDIDRVMSSEVAIEYKDSFIYYSPFSISPLVFGSVSEFSSYNYSKKELAKEAFDAL